MKKIIASVMVLMLALSLAACGGDSNSSTSGTSSTAGTTSVASEAGTTDSSTSEDSSAAEDGSSVVSEEPTSSVAE